MASALTRFQLVFRTDTGDRTELRDNSDDGEAHVNGVDLRPPEALTGL